MKKYYWFCLLTKLAIDGQDMESHNDAVTVTHPFVLKSALDNEFPENRHTLINWKEIDQTDYDLYPRKA